MSLAQFTNLDFSDLRTQIKDYLRANSNFTDFDFEGSNFSVLIDILAYNSYITAFNTNMAVNEAFIDSATLRENVVSLSRNIGYVPRSARSSRAVVSFSVNVSNLLSKTVTLKAGIVALGSAQNGNYSFVIPEDITVNVDSTGIASFDNIDIYEGILLRITFVSDYSQPQQKFIIPNSNIDTNSIRVIVNTNIAEQYKQYANIFEVNPSSKIFLLQEILNEQYQILFGDDILGKRPPNKSIIAVSYVVTNGKSANGAANFTFSGVLIDNNQNSVTTGVSLLNTIQSSENGDDIEPIESIKYLGPRVYSSQYRAVTANDYKSLIPYLFPNVESVNAYGGDELTPPQYGKVIVSAKPRNGSYLSEVTKNEIKKQIKKYSIAGMELDLIDLKYLYIELETSVYYNANSTSNVSDLQSKVFNTIKSFAQSSELNNFGGRFKYSKLVSLIDNTSNSITSNITKVKMRRDLQPALNTLATYELCYGNAMHVQKTSISGLGFNLKSTGFTINNNSDILYITDRPNSSNNGIIVFFKLINNIPTIVVNSAGTVIYSTGEIRLDPFKITSSISQNGIEIEAVPESNDIVSVRDIYLQLNIPKVINMISDTLSSGENISGNLYTFTSSYANEQYTR
jgi:hypothetical protein